MVVKQDRKTNIPWCKIRMATLILIVISGVAILIHLAITVKAEHNKERKLKREKILRVKIVDIVSKKYHVTCSKNIISPANYNIVKVQNTYRLIVGSDTTTLDETHRISDCDIIYDITETNLRFKVKDRV